jgi:hypothetical protein
MNEKEFPEYKEGYRAYKPGYKPQQFNPYPWTNHEWWRHEAFNKGWKAAEEGSNDDDYDDGGKGPAGWPSTTGNPSGGGRQNA